MMLLFSSHLLVALFAHFGIINFFDIYICICYFLFHFTFILLFFHFWIEVVCIETLVIWKIYLHLICLPCLRNSLLNNQIYFFVVLSNLAENNWLTHYLVKLIEWIITLVIHFIIQNVAMTVLFRHFHFVIWRWSHLMVLIAFTLEIRNSNICCYFRCICLNFLCLFNFDYFLIIILNIYLCKLIITNCWLILYKDILLVIMKHVWLVLIYFVEFFLYLKTLIILLLHFYYYIIQYLKLFI